METSIANWKSEILGLSSMIRKLFFRLGLLQAVSCQLKVYIMEDPLKPGMHQIEKFAVHSILMCASICAQRGCSTMAYEKGEVKQNDN